ncbi:bzip transcription factor [Moniliophthora roreri MCA 2997]|uniref:Bzip transcription factor n=2 Tax=Moniliophthora roreri TaxID=221103 RepID=V2XZE4_MONRO|nr:bzip transcription factor [Moniliophthora roreri MCA 2997]KAI3621944.1 bzip transcription factor [Moniliophthora roreri]
MISRLENINDSATSPIDPEHLNAAIQAELSRWQHLDFSFDMDEKQHNGSESSTPGGSGQRLRTPSQSQNVQPPTATEQDALLLTQFAATVGGSQNPSSDANSYAALLHYLQSQSTSAPLTAPSYPVGGLPNVYQNTVLPTPMPVNPTLWQQQPFQPHQHSNSPQHMHPFGAGQPGSMHLSNLHLPPLVLPPYNPQNTNQGGPTLSPGLTNPNPGPSRSSTGAHSQASASSPSMDDEDEATQTAITEDKRRRNTAASARFRIKKKMRNLNLEHTVSELSGRADTLEREAADLRRENGWLKEIVMLKGSRLAGIDISPHTIPTAESSSQAQKQSTDIQDSQSQSEGSSDEYQPGNEGRNKRKGKGKEKK